MAAVTICSDFLSQENKVCHCFHCFPIYLTWNDGARCHDLAFWTLNFKPAFSLSSSLSSRGFLVLFTFCHKDGVICISEVIDISPGNLYSSLSIIQPGLSFHIMYSAYKLNKQGDSIQPWRTPFPIWNQSVVPCPVLTVASLPAYRFLKRQVRWSDIPISFRIFHIQYLDAISKMTEWSLFVSKANHSISQ